MHPVGLVEGPHRAFLSVYGVSDGDRTRDNRSHKPIAHRSTVADPVVFDDRMRGVDATDHGAPSRFSTPFLSGDDVAERMLLL